MFRLESAIKTLTTSMETGKHQTTTEQYKGKNSGIPTVGIKLQTIIQIFT